MKTAENLLRLLGVSNYTQRHISIINDFLKTEETDVKKLLDQLGGWDSNDLKIAESWMSLGQKTIAFEIIEKDIEGPRITLTPTRTTLKYPLNFPIEQKTFIEKQLPAIISEVKADKAWRGRFDKTGITLWNDSKKEKLRFDFK